MSMFEARRDVQKQLQDKFPTMKERDAEVLADMTVKFGEDLNDLLKRTLQGLDPSPFRGYLLHVRKPWRRDMEAGWYFRKVESADEEFTAWIKKIKVKEKSDA